MGKKVLKIVGILFLLFVGLLIAAPFILEAKIGDLIKNNVNNNINATLDFSSAKLSLVKSFPNAEVGLEGVTLITKAPFEGDTLFAAKDLSLIMGIGQLFKSEGDPIAIKNVNLDGANIYVRVNEDQVANYEIGKDDGSNEVDDSESEGFSLDLQSYAITNSKVTYDDRAAKVYLVVSDIQHYGDGDLSATTSELNTKTEAFVTFELDSTNYLNKNKIKLDALIGIDLKEDKYTFLKNEALLNQLPLIFEGFVKVNETNQEIDISFKTPSSDFKNFLAIIPETYSKNIENVKTTGDFVVEGRFHGVVDENHIPKFNIKIGSENASFKYPDLPKSVRNVYIDTEINNTTGIAEDTYVDIEKLSFMIDEDKFNAVAKITELMGNTKVKAHVDGRMNLANIEKAYPVPEDLNLKGLLNVDIATAFDMASIDNKQYENTNTTGSMTLKDFEYSSNDMPHPVKLKSTALTFNPKTVTLNELNGTTGKTDFNATGIVDNFLGFLFNDEKVEGNFKLKSNTFALSDFMVEEEISENGSQATEEKIKIPAFLDCTINASANTVLYDNLVLKNVKGNLRIKDEKAILTNMTSTLFDGKLAFNGEVSTKEEIPVFSMELNMDKLKIGETFKAMELLRTIAPIASILEGKFNSNIKLSGKLTDDLLPDMKSLSGDLVAEILATNIKPEEAPVLSSLSSGLQFLDLQSLDLKGLKTLLSFENGAVAVKPFTLNYKDMAVNVTGSHTFDQQMTYQAAVDVPAKYLGSEITGLIAKIDEKELENLTIPVVANIGGNYTSPTVSTDLTNGIKSLTTKLINIQKQKLINQGKNKAKDLLGNILSGNSSEKDTTPAESSTKESVKEVLGGLLGDKTDEEDSTVIKNDSIEPEKDVIKEAATSILGGFLRKKDTVN